MRFARVHGEGIYLSLKGGRVMSNQTTRRIVKPWQAVLMLLVGIAIIIVGLLVLKLNNRIVLAIDGVVMCVMASIFGIKYDDLQAGIKETISSMIVAILILFAVGVLVATWMISGTVPFMIYYGMKLLTPGMFLPVVCLLCTFMSALAGTSWGTLATVGVACMGVAQGLGVPLEVTAGAVCVGAFFGDKPRFPTRRSLLSVVEINMMEGITLFALHRPCVLVVTSCSLCLRNALWLRYSRRDI